MPQSKNWCFTLNNYDDDDEEILRELGSNERVQYLVYGRERAPETGTAHLQGYVELDRRFRLEQLKRFFGDVGRAHFEAAKGDGQSNRAYCTKDGDFVEHGSPCAQGQGRRNDIQAVRDVVKRTGSIREVAESCTSYQSLRFAEAYVKYHEPARRWQSEVRWFCGGTGTGKTRTAAQEAEDGYERQSDELSASVYWKIPGTKWFDGYDAHPNVILDDFRPDWFSFSYLLGLLDRYPFCVETKGGTRQFLARRIWITAPSRPELMFCSQVKEDDINQLLRRITEIREF